MKIGVRIWMMFTTKKQNPPLKMYLRTDRIISQKMLRSFFFAVSP